LPNSRSSFSGTDAWECSVFENKGFVKVRMKQKWGWVHVMSQYSPTPLADKLIDEWNNTCSTTEMIADRDLSYLCSPCCDNNDKKRESHQNKTKLEIDWRNKWAPTKGRGKSVLLEIHSTNPLLFPQWASSNNDNKIPDIIEFCDVPWCA
jgi:hypothetical protein